MSDQSSKSKSLPSRMATWIEDNWIEVGLYVLPLLLALFMWLTSDEVLKRFPEAHDIRWWVGVAAMLLVAACAFAHFGLIYAHCQKRRTLSTLEDQLQAFKDERDMWLQDIHALSEAYLLSLAKGPLKFGTQDNNCERITLYVHDSNGSFLPIGRFSFNPCFTQKGRPKYPDNQGAIAKAWQHGWCFINDYPDPHTAEIGYQKRCEKEGIPQDVLDTIRMKSRLFCGYTIWNSSHRRQLAVLLIEATEPERYTEQELKQLLQQKEREYLCDLLERLEPRLPDTGDAKEQGF